MGKDERAQENDFYEMIKLVAPGTVLREGLENVLKARTGALIVIGDSAEVLKLVNGGFRLNQEFTPSLVYELAKMDGAVVLSKDLKQILYANVQLIPDPTIATEETGTRHRTAERVAKQTGEVVISISQRRNVITLFKGNSRYLLRDTVIILNRANQALQTLEKYKNVFDGIMNNMSILEFQDMVTLENVCLALQKSEMVDRIAKEIERYIYELGDEGRLVKMQLEELVGDTDKMVEFLLKDYLPSEKGKALDEVRADISAFTYAELADVIYIAKALGYQNTPNVLETGMLAKGYRVLSMIPRLPFHIIPNLVQRFTNIRGILNATFEELDDVEGIGEVRARNIKEGLKVMREQYFLT